MEKKIPSYEGVAMKMCDTLPMLQNMAEKVVEAMKEYSELKEPVTARQNAIDEAVRDLGKPLTDCIEGMLDVVECFHLCMKVTGYKDEGRDL